MFLLSFGVAELLTQSNMPTDRASFYRYGNNFLTDVVVQSSLSNDSLEAIVLYRVINAGLVFVQESDNSFISILQIEAAFRDKDGIIRRRAIAVDTIKVSTYEDTQSKSMSHTGKIVAIIPRTINNLMLLYNDNRNQTLHRSSISLGKAQNYLTKPTFLSAAFAGKKQSQYFVYQLENSIPFTSNPLSIFLTLSYKPDETSFSFEITKKEERNQADWGEFRGMKGSGELLKNQRLSLDYTHSTPAINFQPLSLENSTLEYGILKVDLSGNAFVPGSYSLLVYNDKTKDSASFDFKVVWEDMPLALKNPEYALKMMEYILTDDEIKTMRSGSQRDLMKRIINYWSKMDPTPTTPYNEAMAEYFRRVDYAFFNYQTFSEKDGALTDRGMIYILFGKPDIVRNILDKEVTKEIWVYSRLIKEFTFDLISTGVYRLSDIKE